MVGADVQPLVFELAYRAEAYNLVGGKLVRAEDEDSKLADVPTGFHPMRGNHRVITEKATYLNKVQERSGFLHYFYFPQIAGVPVNYDGARA
jgi:hypothetical protein